MRRIRILQRGKRSEVGNCHLHGIPDEPATNVNILEIELTFGVHTRVFRLCRYHATRLRSRFTMSEVDDT